MSNSSRADARSSYALVVLCQAVGWGVFIAWCIPRMKPPVLFGLVFGALFAGIALAIGRLLQERNVRPHVLVVALLAAIGALTTLALSAMRQIPAVTVSHQDAAAAALIATLQQLPDDNSEMPENPGQFRSLTPLTLFERMQKFVSRRYVELGFFEPWAWLGIEILLAGMTAGLIGVWSTSRKPEPDTAELQT